MGKNDSEILLADIAISKQNDTALPHVEGLHYSAYVLFCLGFPANLMIVYLVARIRKLKTPTNSFVASLATADLLVLTWMLLTVIDSTYEFLPLSASLNRFLYPSFDTFDMFLATASLFNAGLVSMDRTIACLYPLQYEQIMLKKVSKFLIVAWVYSCGILGLAMMRTVMKNKDYEHFVFWLCVTLSFFVPVLFLVISYTIIFVCAYRNIFTSKYQYDKVKKTLEYQNNNSKMCGRNIRRDLRKQRKKSHFIQKELRVTAIVLIIVLLFTLGWTFHVGAQLYELIQETFISDALLNFAVTLVPWLLSSLNAYVYFMFNRPIRKTFFKAIARFRSKCKYRRSLKFQSGQSKYAEESLHLHSIR